MQLFEFHTERIDEWAAIQERFRAGIGADRTTRWWILGADRDRSGTYLAIVEFPDFRNLDVRLARPY